MYWPHDADGEDRPPPRPQEPCVELSLLMPGGQWSALENAAHGRGLNVGQLLRRLVAAYLANGEDGPAPAPACGHPSAPGANR